MPASLTRTLLESHAAATQVRPRHALAGSTYSVRPDHVLIEGHAATLALLGFEACARPRAPLDAVLVCDGPGAGTALFERGDERRFRMEAARRSGAFYGRPGSGAAHQLYLARFAAPNRLLVANATGASVAGALGSLALGGSTASEIDVAAVLAGSPAPLVVPPVYGVRLRGTLPPWLGGHDLVCALARRLAEAGLAGGVLEFDGAGVDALPIAERCTVARAAETLGAAACLFPSDERTRAWLKSIGREPDWKPLATAPEHDARMVLELDLDTLEPLIHPADDLHAARAVGETGVVEVTQVVVGPDAGLADLLRFAVLLRGRTVAAGVEVIVVPGTRAIDAGLRQDGARDALLAAGVRVAHPGAPIPVATPRAVALACGVPDDARRVGGATFTASIPTCAAAALGGRLGDPRELPLVSPTVEPQSVAPDESWMVKPGAEAPLAELARGAGVAPLPFAPPLVTTLRGQVLIALGDRSLARRILSEGDRVWRHAAHLPALAGFAFADAESGFAARARAARGGFVAAGEGFGAGARQPHATLALVELGVRAVLARSFAPGCAATLVRHGVLPLAFLVAADATEIAAGDELEIPGLPEGLEARKPLVVRDLTRGTQVLVQHDLEPREIELVRAGGIIPWVRATGPAGAGPGSLARAGAAA